MKVKKKESTMTEGDGLPYVTNYLGSIGTKR